MNSSANHKPACFVLLNMMKCGVKNFAFRIIEAFNEPKDRLRWFKEYEAYAKENSSKGAMSGLGHMTRYLDAVLHEDISWWEKMK